MRALVHRCRARLCVKPRQLVIPFMLEASVIKFLLDARRER